MAERLHMGSAKEGEPDATECSISLGESCFEAAGGFSVMEMDSGYPENGESVILEGSVEGIGHLFGEETTVQAQTRPARYGQSRLWFLLQYVSELVFANYFLQRYTRESSGPLRERVYTFFFGENLVFKKIRLLPPFSLQTLTAGVTSDESRELCDEVCGSQHLQYAMVEQRWRETMVRNGSREWIPTIWDAEELRSFRLGMDKP